ncbi:MAG TPA: RNA 2',3'-cyclic phosphodiesterase [Azospira sp.]|nr:RNA 2',3'-cyclic phosphodiesterase [Azospira sp.]
MSGSASPAISRPRVFFALWPDEALAERLAALATAGAKAGGGRAMARETLHLTLAFIGEVASESLSLLREAGAAAWRQAAWPLEFALDRVGDWQHHHLLWLGHAGPVSVLDSLVMHLTKELEARGFALESRPYVPHITLVRRSADEAGARAWAASALPPGEALAWRPAGFSLVRSRRLNHGAAYERLADWPAAGGEGRP